MLSRCYKESRQTNGVGKRWGMEGVLIAYCWPGHYQYYKQSINTYFVVICTAHCILTIKLGKRCHYKHHKEEKNTFTVFSGTIHVFKPVLCKGRLWSKHTAGKHSWADPTASLMPHHSLTDWGAAELVDVTTVIGLGLLQGVSLHVVLSTQSFRNQKHQIILLWMKLFS